MVAGLAGLRFGVGFGLLSPRIERGALCGLDAEPNIAPLGAGVAELVQVGAAAGVAQAGGTRHADAPLSLQIGPGLPGDHVVWPEVEQQICALPGLLSLRGLGGDDGGQPGVGLVWVGGVSMGGLWGGAVVGDVARQPG